MLEPTNHRSADGGAPRRAVATKPRRAALRCATLCLTVLTAACSSPDADVAEADMGGVRTIGESASFRGINGILFGPDGDLYLASVVTPAVARLDPETGEILDNWGLGDGPKSPDDLAFGPDGSVYWTDTSNGEVAMRTPDGETRVIAAPGAGVNPITFSDDGRLFVSQCFMDTGLFELDPKGVAAPRLIRDDLGPGCGLNGMDWGSADGKLYGPRWFRGEVVRIDVDSGEMETVASGFEVPAAVKFNGAGELHVLDSLRGEVVRIGEDGSKDVVARVQPGLDNFAFDASDRLFISSFADGFIVEALSPEENRVVLEGGLNMPGGVALIGTGDTTRLVVADFFALRQLDPDTGDELGVVRDVIGFSDIGSSMSVHATDDGQLVLSSWFDNAVRLWDPETDALVQTFAGLAAPIDALMFGGDIVASQWGAGNVIAFSPGSPEEQRILAEGLEGPAGLTDVGRQPLRHRQPRRQPAPHHRRRRRGSGERTRATGRAGGRQRLDLRRRSRGRPGHGNRPGKRRGACRRRGPRVAGTAERRLPEHDAVQRHRDGWRNRVGRR